jgi:hypothetical protein
MNLPAVLLASAATNAQQPAPVQNGPVVVEARRILPSVGLMNDHMHERGEFMIGVRFQHFDWGGTNRHGTRKVSDEDLFDAGYMMRAKSMTMDMAMLDLMYGVTDNLTLTVSPQYVWNRMKMVGIDPMGGMDGSMAFGEVDKETSGGFGDTQASASLRIARSEHVSVHVTLGVWAPTGRSGLKMDGTFVEYCMQPGSGTWDLEPSGTIRGQEGRFGWGAQAVYRLRAEHRNNAGYRLGNKALVTGWLSYLVGPNMGATVRAEFAHQGRIRGQYDGQHNEEMPPDFPANYGGDFLTGEIGLNWEPTVGSGRGPQLGVEVGVPLYQHVNGVQLPQRWQLTAAVRQFF